MDFMSRKIIFIMVFSEKKDKILMFVEDFILFFINCKNISSWIFVIVGFERLGILDSILSVGFLINYKFSV